MKEKFKAHFLKFGARPFVVTVVLSLIITDLLNVWFLKIYWIQKNISYNLASMVANKQGYNLQDLAPDSIAELLGVANNFFFFFLFVILINNAFFYLFYLRKKLWAQGFILTYTLTAALFQVTFITDSLQLGLGWSIYNILTIPYYVYIFCGVKLLKHETTNLNLSSGKVAQ